MFLLHIECLQGRGEITQALELTRKLLEKGAMVTVATGSGIEYFNRIKYSSNNLTILELPPLSFDKMSGTYRVSGGELHLPNGGYSEAGNTTINERSDLICRASEKADSIILASGWPLWLGEGILDVELHKLLEQNAGKEIFIATREVIHADSPMVSGGENHVVELFNHYPNMKWLVFGDAKLLPITVSFPEASQITNTQQIYYAGYGAIMETNQLEKTDRIDKVVVSGGGGDFRDISCNLIMASIMAAKESHLKEASWFIIVGNNYPQDKKNTIASLVNQARDDHAINIQCVSELPPQDYKKLLQGNTLFIGHAGIGAVNDIIASHMRALLLPIDSHIKTRMLNGEERVFHFKEQGVRATTLADKKLIGLVSMDGGSDRYNYPAEDLKPLVDALIQGIENLTNVLPSFNPINVGGFESASRMIARAANDNSPVIFPAELPENQLKRSYVERMALKDKGEPDAGWSERIRHEKAGQKQQNCCIIM